MMAALICSGVQSGCTCLTSAAIPAVCGLDMEVPLSTKKPVPVPAPADAMVSPGAVTSGLTTPVDPCTPREENDDKVSTIAGFCSCTVDSKEPVNVTSN